MKQVNLAAVKLPQPRGQWHSGSARAPGARAARASGCSLIMLSSVAATACHWLGVVS